MPRSEVTESWRDKNYEGLLTDYYFEITKRIKNASNLPILFNLKLAFSDLKSFSYSVVYSPDHLKKFESDIKPILDDIEKILYGSEEDVNVLKIMRKYGVTISRDRHNRVSVNNSQAIIGQLWEVLFIIKQWAYEQGFFVVKPFSRKVGIEALEDAMIQ